MISIDIFHLREAMQSQAARVAGLVKLPHSPEFLA